MIVEVLGRHSFVASKVTAACTASVLTSEYHIMLQTYIYIGVGTAARLSLKKKYIYTCIDVFILKH